MQVLLLNPRSEFLQDPAFVPPLGLLYLGTALEANEFDVKVADLNIPDTRIDGHDPRLIGISCVTANFAAVRDLVTECRRMYPGVPVVVGGPHLSVKPWDAERLGANWGGDGDCEEKMLYLASTLRKGFDVPAGRLPDWGDVDVNRYPFPARHMVPIHEYACQLDGEPATSIVGQRGCPFACAFCSRWTGSRKVRARAVENVIEEIRQIKALGFRSVVFHDDEMNLLNDRLIDLCRDLAPEQIRFKANARADLFTSEQAEALAAAGCSWLCFGVESGNARILKTARKGTTPQINAQARRICRDAGIKFKAFVIVGLPGETRETVEETRRWLIENEVDDLTVTMFVPFPGSDVYARPDKYDIQFTLGYETRPLPFRGGTGLNLPHTTRTAGLSAEELAEMPERIEYEVRLELGTAKTYQGAPERQ
jgi:anaerobic magnesium-protoporphyrin IX monomethyl ester cyclase